MNDLTDQFRKTIRRRRRLLGVGAQCRAAQQLAKDICSLECYQQSRHIALYLGTDGELDCRFFLKQAWRDGKQCYLPVLKKGNDANHSMSFIHYSPGGELVNNRYGILEPKPSLPILPQALDLVLVPLVGFDRFGHRIGMGGGYYDRAFAFKKDDSNKSIPRYRHIAKPILLGVAHRLQEIEHIEPQPWDVSLDHMVKV